jgi:hypothetical protein
MNYQSYLNDTIESSLFQIEDVIGDNKCFYRSVVNSLLWRTDLSRLDTPDSLISRKVFKTPNSYLSVYDGNYTKILPKFNDIEPIDFQSDAILYLESKTQRWISRNRDKRYEPLGFSISDIVTLTHDMSIVDYVKRDISESDLWGGLLEQVALSNMYGCPILIYRATTFNKNTNKINEGIIAGDSAKKNVRFKLSQIIKPVKVTSLPIYLLWKRYSSGVDHYMTLYLKD